MSAIDGDLQPRGSSDQHLILGPRDIMLGDLIIDTMDNRLVFGPKNLPAMVVSIGIANEMAGCYFDIVGTNGPAKEIYIGSREFTEILRRRS